MLELSRGPTVSMSVVPSAHGLRKLLLEKYQALNFEKVSDGGKNWTIVYR